MQKVYFILSILYLQNWIMDPIWRLKRKKNEENQCGDYLRFEMVVFYIFKALKFVMAYQYAERFNSQWNVFDCMEMTATN